MAFYVSTKGIIHPYHFDYLDLISVSARLEKTKIHFQVENKTVSPPEKQVDFYAINVMHSPVIAESMNTPVQEIKEKMKKMGIRHIPIINNLKLVGMISDRDILKINNSSTFHFLKAKDIMSTLIVVCDEETPIAHLAQVLLEEKISSLPVIDKNHQLVGMISRTDILKAIINNRLVLR